MFSEREKRVIEEYRSIIDDHHRAVCPLQKMPMHPIVRIGLFYIGGGAVVLLLFLALVALRV